jgi:hypothetical protein
LSVSQNAVSKDNFNKTEVKKIKVQVVVQAVRPLPVDAKPGFISIQLHGAFTMMIDNGQ